MKKVALFLTLFISVSCFAQTSAPKVPLLDKSPMDMIYYPINYPVLKIQDKAVEPLVARVIYSRPQKNNRTVFGDLVEYGKIWRLGANEATEIELFRDVKINGKKLAKGKYTMYAVVNQNSWTMIFNKETNTWGAFKYDATKDALRIDVPVEKTKDIVEAFTILFEKTTTGINLVTLWEDVRIGLPISLK